MLHKLSNDFRLPKCLNSSFPAKMKKLLILAKNFQNIAIKFLPQCATKRTPSPPKDAPQKDKVNPTPNMAPPANVATNKEI